MYLIKGRQEIEDPEENPVYCEGAMESEAGKIKRASYGSYGYHIISLGSWNYKTTWLVRLEKRDA